MGYRSQPGCTCRSGNLFISCSQKVNAKAPQGWNAPTHWPIDRETVFINNKVGHVEKTEHNATRNARVWIVWLIVQREWKQALLQSVLLRSYALLCAPGIIPLSRSKESHCVSKCLHALLCYIFYINGYATAICHFVVTDLIEQVQVSRASELTFTYHFTFYIFRFLNKSEWGRHLYDLRARACLFWNHDAFFFFFPALRQSFYSCKLLFSPTTVLADCLSTIRVFNCDYFAPFTGSTDTQL